MTKEKICLASDNCTAAHPSILEAVAEANRTHCAPSYGADAWTAQAEQLIQRAFKAPDAKVLIVPTGTGANILALKLALKPFESAICTEMAHVNYQESGAAESVVGCKLIPTDHREGKISVTGIIKRLKAEKAFGKHSTHPRLLTISQSTEVGTVYSLEELQTLSKLCKEEGLYFHIDGSRLYNAAVSLDTSLDEIVRAANADILSLGGTKNGLMCAESLVIFNPALFSGADHLHKQNLCLVSKMRYLSAQYIPFFENHLWRTLAQQANERAKEIADLILNTPHLVLSYPVETNQVFFTTPPHWIPLLQDHIFCHIWNKEKNEVRFVTSWNTSKEDILGVKHTLHQLESHVH
jgi:threonine aldolase